jgi:hypothetical protein
MVRTISLGFIAGFLAVLLFHQGTAFVLYHFGNDVPILVAIFGQQMQPPYSMVAVPPFGMPEVIVASFRGGVWGTVLAALLREMRTLPLTLGFAFGALALTAAGFTLLSQMNGLPPLTLDNRQAWWSAGLYNGAWGWGTALLLRQLTQGKP